jgi:tetratricopeptide (TPR) repeat protein
MVPLKLKQPKKPKKKTKKERQAEITQLFGELETIEESEEPDWEEMERLSALIVELAPDDLDDNLNAYYHLSTALSKQEYYVSALDISNKALALASDDAFCHYNMAAALYDLDENDPQIKAYLVKAFELDFTILDDVSDEEDQEWQDLCAEARSGGGIDQSIVPKPAKKITKKDQAAIKRLLSKLKEMDTAIQEKEILSDGENDFDLNDLYSDLNETVAVIKKLPLSDVELAMALCYEVKILLFYDDPYTAMGRANRAIQLDPENAYACFNKACVLRCRDGNLADEEEIREWLIKAVKFDAEMLEDDFVQQMLDEETVAGLSGDKEKLAQSLFNKIVILDGGEEPDLEQIKKLCLDLIALEPENNVLIGDAYSYLYDVLRQQGYYEDALDAALSALELDPNNAIYCYNMAVALEDLDPENLSVQEWLIKAVALDKEMISDEFVWDKLQIDLFLSWAKKQGDKKEQPTNSKQSTGSPWPLLTMALVGAGMAQLGKTDQAIKTEILQNGTVQQC